MQHSFENEFAEFSIHNKLLFLQFKSRLSLNVEAARTIVNDRLHFQDGNAYPILYFVDGIVNSDKAGRDYFAKYGAMLCNANAFVCQSRVPITFCKFYYRFSRPSVPCGFFIDNQCGIVFLNKYL